MEKIYKGEIQRLFPILEAIKEGKTIQWNDMGKWRDIDGDDEGFFLDTLVGKPDGYRIKPEPKYRPFKDEKECWAEMKKHHPFGWIHITDDNLYHNIIMLAPELGCHEAYIRIGNCTVRGLEETFRIATFADGQPFGVKIEEG